MSIFGSLFGDKKTDKLYDKINSVIDELPRSQGSTSTNDDLAVSAINDIIDFSSDDKRQVDQIFKDLEIPNERMKRYALYESIYDSVQIVKRIIKIYSSNIFEKDSVTNRVLFVNEAEGGSNNSEKTANVKKFAKDCIHYFNLETRIKDRVCMPVLKFGDGFVEVINLDETNAAFSDVADTPTTQPGYITESLDAFAGKLKSKNAYLSTVTASDIDNLVSHIVEVDNTPPLAEFSAITEAKQDGVSADFSKVALKYHRPHRIIPLVTQYDNILGYVEIKEIEKATDGKSNPLRSFVEIANKIGSSSYVAGKTKGEKYDNTIGLFVKSIIKKIITKNNIVVQKEDGDKIKTKKQVDAELEEQLKKSLESDLFYSVKKLMLSVDGNALYHKKLRTRFIPVDRMVHFSAPTSDIYPYGISIIDNLVYPGKLYLLTQLANAVTKLSRSAVLRKWNIETGIREQHGQLLQKLKKEFRNSRVTAADLTSTKDLPNMLSDFKDIVTFSKKQQKFVDVDIQQHSDPNIGIRDLEDQRREIVALSGVPSSFLGYQDHHELREKLVHSNVVFAREVSAYQHVFNDGMTDLVDKIAKVTGEVEIPSQYIAINLMPPTVLLLQLIESTMSSIMNIQNYFQSGNISTDPYYLLKRYVPYIDWDKFEESSEKYTQKKKGKKPVGGGGEEEPGGYGGGGFG
jgi:hypothetical protein